MSNQVRPEFSQYLVQKTIRDYDSIASYFSQKRQYLTRDLEYFRRLIKRNDKILDLGCGNGRLVGLFKDKKVEYWGIDASQGLVKEAQKRHPGFHFQKADFFRLTFESGFFDKALAIAVFHHIPSRALRQRFLIQVFRVLKPGGLLILTCWNLWQKRFFRYHLKYTLLKISGLSALDFKDIFYPFKDQKGKVLIQRYLHCFSQKELLKLTQGAGFLIQEKGFLGVRKANLYLILKKPLLEKP